MTFNSAIKMSLLTSRAAALGLFLFVIPATGQEFRGSISGRIVDSTGMGVRGVQLTITNTETKVSTNSTTDDGGNYAVHYLTPGHYSLDVEMQGFKKIERSGVEIQIGDRLTLDFHLELGAVQQEVRVTESTPLLQTSEASAGQIIDEQRIDNLPLPDGNPFVLARAAGGLAFTGNLLFARPFDNGGTSSIRASGAPGASEFTLDGAPDMASGQRVGFVPPSEAVQEFKVITANFDAQQGHTAGAAVNVITKTGTDSLHGSAYEFDRNDALMANDFFSNRLGRPKQKLRYNRWGGAVGGPVFLSKLYNGRQKTFFFFAYEGLKDVQPETNRFTVPTQAERNGDLSALLSPAAGSITIYDPASAKSTSGGHVTRSPLSCNGQVNVICPNRLSPIAQAYLKLYPLPNLPGDAQGQMNYFSGNPRTDHFNSETLRVDHQITSKQKMFLRMYRNWREELRGNWSGSTDGILATGNELFRIND
ncbi:MAG TPA: carboxypeptidase regulatory-like domain-containing protein, partial [Candidatus Dormibacteraeota bacterium]|nr:carboxypeptidase regulatory-like domain-containing protein [Candidatus Dormibacteraeota bacterium]